MKERIARMVFEVGLGFKLALPWKKAGSRLANLMTVGSAVAIGLGLAICIIIFAVLNGCQQMVSGAAIKAFPYLWIGQTGALDFGKISADIDIEQKMAHWLKKHPEARIDARGYGSALVGMDLTAGPRMSAEIIAWEQASEGGALMGATSMSRLGIVEGSKVQLLPTHCGKGMTAAWPFSVAHLRAQNSPVPAPSLVRSGAYGSEALWVSHGEARRIFSRAFPCWLTIELSNPAKAPMLEEEISKLFPAADISTRSWASSHRAAFEALSRQKNGFLLVMSAVVLLASLQMALTQCFAVEAMRQRIASLRTMGASQSSVARIFFVRGLASSAFGCVIGLILGVAVALNPWILDAIFFNALGLSTNDFGSFDGARFPSALSWGDTWELFVGATVICAISSIIPAALAARAQPGEELYHE